MLPASRVASLFVSFDPVNSGGWGFFETDRGAAEGLLQPNIDFARSPIVLRLCGTARGLRSQITIIFPSRINRYIHFEPLACE